PDLGQARCHSDATRGVVLLPGPPDAHESSGVLVRQRSEQHAFYEAVDGRRGPDAEGERQDREAGESRSVRERAKRVADVLEHSVHDQLTIQPSRSCTTRLPYFALSSECVTCTIVVPAALSSRNSAMMSFP